MRETGCTSWQRQTISVCACSCVFFFQAEDGIRDADVTGVQTCALPISPARVGGRTGAVLATERAGVRAERELVGAHARLQRELEVAAVAAPGERRFTSGRKIGRASCRERV